MHFSGYHKHRQRQRCKINRVRDRNDVPIHFCLWLCLYCISDSVYVIFLSVILVSISDTVSVTVSVYVNRNRIFYLNWALQYLYFKLILIFNEQYSGLLLSIYSLWFYHSVHCSFTSSVHQLRPKGRNIRSVAFVFAHWGTVENRLKWSFFSTTSQSLSFFIDPNFKVHFFCISMAHIVELGHKPFSTKTSNIFEHTLGPIIYEAI